MPAPAGCGAGAERAAGRLSGRRDRGEGDGIASTLLEHRRRLAEELRRLRLESGLSTRELALALGTSQSRVTRLENGTNAAPVPDVEAWARATGFAGLAPALGELAVHALTEALSFRQRGSLEERLPRQQREIGELEETAWSVCCYHPTLLPGMAQTPDYIRLVLEAAFPGRQQRDWSARIAAQLERQRLLDAPLPRFELVVPETALRWHLGSVETQRRALLRLREIAGLPSVWLGVVPLAGGTAAWHAHGFNLYELPDDDAVVHVGLLANPVNITDPDDVDRYRLAFSELRDASLTGPPALDLIARVAAELS